MNAQPFVDHLDVSHLPPRERHPLIFQRFEALPVGAALRLENDHDPLPLYYQFGAEYPGAFRWEYLETGPVRWVVLLTRGDFPQPGFVPARRKHPEAVPIHFVHEDHSTAPDHPQNTST